MVGRYCWRLDAVRWSAAAERGHLEARNRGRAARIALLNVPGRGPVLKPARELCRFANGPPGWTGLKTRPGKGSAPEVSRSYGAGKNLEPKLRRGSAAAYGPPLAETPAGYERRREGCACETA